jgi:hypothetical protein
VQLHLICVPANEGEKAVKSDDNEWRLQSGKTISRRGDAKNLLAAI